MGVKAQKQKEKLTVTQHDMKRKVLYAHKKDQELQLNWSCSKNGWKTLDSKYAKLDHKYQEIRELVVAQYRSRKMKLKSSELLLEEKKQ